jgi:archaellum component FlaF (FlaF/FlaG flagellin family)
MGLSVSASVAILFVAVVIVFGTLLSAYDSAQHAQVKAQKDADDRQAGALQTRIAISGIDASNGTVSLVNQGSSTLSVDKLNVLLNGTLSDGSITSAMLNDGTSTGVWMPGEVLVLEFNGTLDGAQVMIVTENGVMAFG